MKSFIENRLPLSTSSMKEDHNSLKIDYDLTTGM